MQQPHNWLYHFVSEAHKNGDTARAALLDPYNAFWEVRQRDPDRALWHLEQGRAQAQALGEKWLVLFYDHWRVECLFYNKRDFAAGLDLVVRAVVESRDPIYEGCPNRLGLHINLINAYMDIDPEGHSQSIESALEYLERAAANDKLYVCRVAASRSEYALARDRLDEARDLALMFLQRAQVADHDHYLCNAYGRLCTVMRKRYDWESLLEYCQSGEPFATRLNYQAKKYNFRIHHALALHHTGEPRAAARLFGNTMAQLKKSTLSLDDRRSTAACDYYMARGELEKALEIRAYYVTAHAGSGRNFYEARARIEYCRLLTALGRSLDAELQLARETANKLKCPERFLNELDCIENGEINLPVPASPRPGWKNPFNRLQS